MSVHTQRKLEFFSTIFLGKLLMKAPQSRKSSKPFVSISFNHLKLK